jgi:glucose-6-phosphate-specific signal transduction histidine kinase
MMGYTPGWLGALIAGMLVGLSILISRAVFSRQRQKTSTFIIAAVTGVALAFVIRNLLLGIGN